jgi:molybdenum transport protein
MRYPWSGTSERFAYVLNYISDSDIENFIHEDVPYGDLTTHLLGIGDKMGKIIFSTREEITLCCTEEAARLLNRLGAETIHMLPSGTVVSAGTEFLEARGKADTLHAGWKAALNLLEYASGVASRIALTIKAAWAE